MPLTFPNRSRAAIGPRGVLAFAARDGRKSVCCLLPLTTIAARFGGDEPVGLFDHHRAVIEAAASAVYDMVGSDECGELVITEADLGSTRARGYARASAAIRNTPYLPPPPLFALKSSRR